MSVFFCLPVVLSLRTVTSSNPAIVSEAATRPLPRAALIGLCLAYALPGYIGREPWKSADVVTYGLARWIADGSLPAFGAEVLGTSVDSAQTLPVWLAALFVAWSPLPADMAYRLPFLGALLLTLFLTWHAMFRLSLQPAAQPLAFAFGGQAQPIDYARALADTCVMTLLACLGLAQVSHEAAPDIFLTAATAAMLYGAADLARLDRPVRITTWVAWLGGLAALGLTGMPILAVVVSIVIPVLIQALNPLKSPSQPTRQNTLIFGLGLLIAVATLFACPSPTAHVAEDWSGANPGVFLKLLAWFAWPAWPLALWAVWRWRHRIRAPHIQLPLTLFVLVLMYSIIRDDADRILSIGLPALAVLASFALPTLNRSVGALIDWFSVLFFSVCGFIIWVVWFAMTTGAPTQPAANVARLAPGFIPVFQWPALVIGAFATISWIGLVKWRVSRHPPALWKSLVLASAGSTVCWLLLMTLWLPLLNHARSYGPVSRKVAQLIPTNNCAYATGLTLPQIMGLAHQGGVRLQSSTTSTEACMYAIAPGLGRLPVELDKPEWLLIAKVNRLTDNKESLLVYRQVQPSTDVKSDPESDQEGNAR